MTRLRRITLFIVVLSIILGISAVSSLLDPYSIYGRFSLYVLKPLWASVLNLWSAVDSAPEIRIALASVAGITLALLTMAVIGAVAFKMAVHFATQCVLWVLLSALYRIIQYSVST